MDNNDSFLALYLDAPLQSWGYQSRFDRRTSLSYPTRSGIIGMICAAMGVDRSDTEGLQLFETLTISVYTFRQGRRLVDFHTVGGGWDKKKNPQCIVPKADGKAGQTVVSRREYLQHSRYGVILQVDKTLGQRIVMALTNPIWGIWLGRKSCIPASPVFQGQFGSEREALTKLVGIAGPDILRVIKEVKSFEDGTDTFMDNPLDFSLRRFKPRRIMVE
jgi:CRISPR system Cascade subunit CasD